MKRLALLFLCILSLLLVLTACKSEGSLGDSGSQPHVVDERDVLNPASSNPYVKGLQEASLKYNFAKGADLFFETYPNTTLTNAILTTRNNHYVWDFSATDGTMIYRQELDANTGDVLWDGQMAPPEHMADRLETMTFDYKKVEDFKNIAKETVLEHGGSIQQIDLVLEGSQLAYYVIVETDGGNFTVPIKKELV